MSSADVAAGRKIECLACHHLNESEAKFCAGCGHGLYEPCGQCGESVRLDQKFCGGCGANLTGEVEAKRDQLKKWVALSVQKAKEHDYSEALTLLSRVTSKSDYRLQDIVNNARATAEKVRKLADDMKLGADQRIEKARQAARDGDHEKVVHWLDGLPPSLMDQESTQMLARSRGRIDQLKALRGDLSESIDGKDWNGAGHLLEQLLELVPDDPKYVKLSGQVAQKLIRSADRRLLRQDYSGAAEQLAAVPSQAHDAPFHALSEKVRTIRWLSEQFDAEPYATPTLGRLAVRFAKEAPNDRRAARLVKDLSARVKRRSSDPRRAFSSFSSRPDGWLGGDVSHFLNPQSIDCSETPLVRQLPGRFGVAMGLALQGLGLTRVDRRFAGRKGLLGKIGSRAKSTCWGIDVGSSAIHAICLRKDKSAERPVAVDAYFAELESPTSRASNENREPLIVKAGVEKMLETISTGDATVMSNFSSSSVVSRFLRLPPVKDKQVAQLIESEAKQQIPIPLADLDLVTWTAELSDELWNGRPAMIAAAKKSLVQNRIDNLKNAGLEVAGLQSDTIALANFASFEFADLLAEERHQSAGETTFPSVALIDAGASATRLVLVSADTCWYWTIDSGSEDLTSIIARITRKTKDEAESLRRNPAQLTQPCEHFEPIENKLSELRGRLGKVAKEGMQKEKSFDVRRAFCFGGGCLTHGWIRRVLLKSVE